MPEEQKPNIIDMLASQGGAIKSVGNDEYELCMYKFTSPERPDLTNEYFSDDTDFVETSYPFTTKLLYHHALDNDLSVHPIGQIKSAERRHGDGIYGRFTIDFVNPYKEYLKTLNQPASWKIKQEELAFEYELMLKNLAQNGKLGGSGGALPQGVIVDDNGKIKRWNQIEYSVTPSPAEYQYTRLTPVKSLPVTSLRELVATNAPIREGGSAVVNNVSNIEIENSTKGLKTMDLEQLKQLIQEVLAPFMAALRGEAAETGVNADDAMATAEKEAVDAMGKDPDEMKSLTREVVEKRVEEITTAVVGKAISKAMSKQTDASNAVKAAKAAAQKNEAGREPMKGFSGSSSGSNTRFSVSENLKYAHLTANDMLLGHEILMSEYTENQRKRLKSSDVVSEEYLKHMVAKTVADVEKNPGKDIRDQLYIKSVMKANEVDSQTNTGFGPEWVGQVWSSRIWEKARVLRVYEQMIAKGMMEVEVPQGSSTANISTEEADPTVYSYPQINDVDATGRPTVELKITPFGTGTVALTPGALGMASAYSVILEEDSVIPILPQLSYQQEQKAQETIEQVIVNGDTATAANTNINLIDGTPGTTTSRPYYLASNGILKYPLVTATALSYDAGGTLSLDTFRRLIALFAPQFQTRLDNLFWMVDPYATVTALALPEIATDDVRRTNATITSGQIKDLFGITYFNEGFMLKANSAGKIPAAGGTLGRIALVYAPYWAFGFKRQIKVETGYDPLTQTKVLVTTLRFGLVNRGRDAASVAYNVGLS